MALVILPLVSTVIVGILVEVPYVPLATPLAVSVATPVTFALPSNAVLVYVISPDVDMVLPVVNTFALDAVPLKVPVIIPVEKLPVPSLLTIVLGVFKEVAELTDDAILVIVDEPTPPTLFTVGISAVPPKSLVNFKIPFIVDDASDAPEPPTKAATKAVVATCVELVPGKAVGAVGVPVKDGDAIVALNNISAEFIVILVVLAAMEFVLLVILEVLAVTLVLKAFSALVALVTSAVILAVLATIELVFEVILAVLAIIEDVLLVILAVFEAIKVGKVVIVNELTPPTLFTVGISAVPPKSLVNFKTPFIVDDASDAPEPPTNAATKAVVAN
jgi:hypothetical protein